MPLKNFEVALQGAPHVQTMNSVLSFVTHILSYKGDRVTQTNQVNFSDLFEAEGRLDVMIPLHVLKSLGKDEDDLDDAPVEMQAANFTRSPDEPQKCLFLITVRLSPAPDDFVIRRADETVEQPLSIERLVEELAPIIKRELAASGYDTQMHEVRWRKETHTVSNSLISFEMA